MIAGCIGSFVGTPAELTLIRMTADGRLPPGKSLFDNLLESVSVS